MHTPSWWMTSIRIGRVLAPDHHPLPAELGASAPARRSYRSHTLGSWWISIVACTTSSCTASRWRRVASVISGTVVERRPPKMNASIATPSVFTPARRGGRTLVDGAVVNPVPVAPTVDDPTDLTIAVDLSGPAEPQPAPAVSASLLTDNRYRRQILKFVDSLRPQRKPDADGRGLIDVAFASMQTMQDTITRLKLAGCPPDVLVQVPRDACGFFEFWRAEELIELGRARAAQAMATAMQGRT